MNWSNLSLNKKVGLSLGVLLLVISAMAAVFMVTLQGLAKDVEVSSKAQSMAKTMTTREVDHLKWINTLQDYVYNEKKTELSIQEDPTKCAFGQWYYGEGRKQAEADFPVLKEELAKIDAAHAALHQSAGAIRTFKQADDIAAAENSFEQVSVGNMAAVQASLMAIEKLLEHEQAQMLAQFEFSSLRAQVITMVSGTLGAVLTLLMILLISRSITRPIMGLAGFADRVAQGDYSARSQISRKDEIGSLAASFDVMVDNMVSTINLADEKAREAGEQSEKARAAMQEAEAARLEAENATRRGMQEAALRLETIVQATASSCETLREAVELASQGAEEQLKFATETASAMTEMTGAILEVANNSGAAAASADEASKNADHGSELVTQTMHSIAEVNQKSSVMALSLNELGEQAQGIGQVMNVITDIADQTNLLALNAAIEAARAGEAGRGFAVVADEVRKLAEKTMQATTEVDSVIKALQQSVTDNLDAMEASTRSVEESTNLAQEAGNSLKAILDISGITAVQVSAIATASEQQSATSEEINKGTEEINRLAERNAELMTRSGETLDELVSLTRQISGLVEELKAA